MAGFWSNTREEAEAKLRDFPENWIGIERVGGVGQYRSKSDPQIIAEIRREGSAWFTAIDLDPLFDNGNGDDIAGFDDAGRDR